MNKWTWFNIFFRDILLTLVIVWVNYTLHFRSWFAAFILGMIVVLSTWHLDEILHRTRRLS